MSENKSDAGNHGKTGPDAASEEGAPGEGIDHRLNDAIAEVLVMAASFGAN